MKTTPAQPAAVTTLSDLEVDLFSSARSRNSAASAFITAMSHARLRRSAPVTAFVPQPPRSGRVSGVVESVLLRAG